jgi:hypothetical protein
MVAAPFGSIGDLSIDCGDVHRLHVADTWFDTRTCARNRLGCRAHRHGEQTFMAGPSRPSVNCALPRNGLERRASTRRPAIITIIAAAVGAFGSEYLRTRGKNFATTADFERLQQQLSEQTKLVETIKAEISQKDWAAREWINVRRVKLEELLNKAGECDSYRERWRVASMDVKALTEDRHFGGELGSLATFYFPELMKEVSAYLVLLEEMVLDSINLAEAIDKAGKNEDARHIAHKEQAASSNEKYGQLLKARAALDAAARKLMEQIMGVEKG